MMPTLSKLLALVMLGTYGATRATTLSAPQRQDSQTSSAARRAVESERVIFTRLRGGDVEDMLEEDDDQDEEMGQEVGSERAATDDAGSEEDVDMTPKALTRDEIIAKLNTIPTFCILNEDGGVVGMKSPEGEKCARATALHTPPPSVPRASETASPRHANTRAPSIAR